MINHAKRPVLYVGGGVVTSGASEELKKLAEKIDAPVTTTLLGLSAFPTAHPLSLGMLGMHGTAYANLAVTNCDLLIAVGARFDDRVTGMVSEFAPEAKVIHIDIDPAEIGKNVRVNVPIVGDAKNILGVLLEMVHKLENTHWHEMIREWKKEYPLTYNKTQSEDNIRPQYVVEQIWEETKGEAIIATEVGQNQMWAAQYYKFTRPRSFVSSGGVGTMGFGFPAAIGAQVGCPERVVFDIAGDGSFQMNIQELATAVRHNIPVKVAILNNQFLGMVRQWQEIFHNRRYSNTCLRSNPDFVKIAEAYGAKGILVRKPEEVRPAIKEALRHNGPVVMDFRIVREENVYPMVPPNSPIHKMLGVKEG